MISKPGLHRSAKITPELTQMGYEKAAGLDSLRFKVSKYVGNFFSEKFRYFVQNAVIVKKHRKTNFSKRTIENLFSRILIQAQQYQQNSKNKPHLTLKKTLKACAKISQATFNFYSKFVDQSLIPNWNIKKIGKHLVDQFDPDFLEKKIAYLTDSEIIEIISSMRIVCSSELNSQTDYKSKTKKVRAEQSIKFRHPAIASPLPPLPIPLPSMTTLIAPVAPDESITRALKKDIFVGFCA